MESLSTIVKFLDKELRTADFEDSSNNGLQVENSGKVAKICCGVDACIEFFDQARGKGADLVICHHGLSWNDSLKRVTELNYKRLAFLVRYDMALYASHLPLDAHPRYGNNAKICRALGLTRLRPFGNYRGNVIGFRGTFSEPMGYEAFKSLVRKTINRDIRSMDFGRRTVRSVAVISGGGCEEVAEAGRDGVDVYLTGESALSAYHVAQEYAVNVVFAGHYATEVFGVRALTDVLAKRFKVKAEFIDLETAY